MMSDNFARLAASLEKGKLSDTICAQPQGKTTTLIPRQEDRVKRECQAIMSLRSGNELTEAESARTGRSLSLQLLKILMKNK